MANDSRTDMTSVWKNQPVGGVRISLEQLAQKSRKFENRILWRNVREYVASAIVVGTFAYTAWLAPDLLIRTGCALVITGTLFVVYTLHQRGSSRSTPTEMARQNCLEFHRAELIRQRDLLRSVCTWYLLPLVPGLALFLIGVYRQTMKQPNAAAHVGVIAAAFWFSGAVCTLVFIGVAKLNAWGARKIQEEIDALSETTS